MVKSPHFWCMLRIAMAQFSGGDKLNTSGFMDDLSFHVMAVWCIMCIPVKMTSGQ